MNKLPLDKRLQVLGEHIVRARIHFDLWWFLEGEDSFPLISETLDEFPEFFLLDTNAQFVSMIIRSAVVWDHTRDTVSLPKLANEILDPVRSDDHKEIQAEVERLRKSCKGILKIRHEAIAHVSAKGTRAEVFREAKIIPKELPAMMDEWLAVTNKLLKIRNMVEVEFRDLPLRQLQELVHRLGGPDLRPKSSLDDIFGT